MRLNILIFCHVFMFSAVYGAAADDWLFLGHTANRASIAVDGPMTIDASTLAWIAYEDPSAPEYDLEYVCLSSPAVYDGKVYTYAKYYDIDGYYTQNQIVCFDGETGQWLWYTPIDKRIEALTSYSSPCIDQRNHTVIIGSGSRVFALDTETGDPLWSSLLQRTIVNASVCIATDIVPSRAFITDYDGSGSQGRIYCINLDPNDPGANPYNPGDIIWSDRLGGTSGNSPAYQDGVVYVASITDPNHSWSSGNPTPSGTVSAYAAAGDEPTLLWRTTDFRFDGFFGGVCVTKEGFLYAANYDFYDGENNSALCKLDCSNGDIVWVTPAERTKSIPVVAGDKIFLSGGLDAYGSRSKLQVFQDLGSSAQLLYETSSLFGIGSWTHQPVYANNRLYISKAAGGGYGANDATDLYILDTTLTPDDGGFVIDHYAGCGSSPAVTHDAIYTLGGGGLYKFYQPHLLGDVNRSGQVDVVDLQVMAETWLFDGAVGITRADLTMDGRVQMDDFDLFAEKWLE